MRVEVLMDTTLTVTKGQIVDIPDKDFELLAKLGRVKAEKKEKKKK
jgi:hypothetical protein